MKLQENKTYQEDLTKLVASALRKFGITQNNSNYDDLFSESLLVIAKSCYDETKAKFSTYVFSHVRFTVLNYYNKQKNTPYMVNDYDFDSKASSYNLENEIINKLGPDYSKNLKLALSKLKEKEVELIKKHIFENMSFSQIANLNNKSKQSVQQMFTRIIGRLREEFLNNIDDFEMCI